jgi:hypothetical protein
MICKSNINRTSIRTQSKLLQDKITSDILQPSTSKSLKEIELSSPILQKNLALFVEKVFAVLGFFAQGVGDFYTPIKVRGLLAFETTSLEVVIVHTFIFLAIRNNLPSCCQEAWLRRPR